MARPRVYVNRLGKPVKSSTGVSYNRTRQRFYIIPASGKRQEFKNWEDARAALATMNASEIPSDELSRIAAIARHRSDLAYGKIYSDEHLRDTLDASRINIPHVIRNAPLASTIVSFAQTANALADEVGVPRLKIERDAEAIPSGPRLRHIIEKWKAHKAELRRQTTQHDRTVERYWTEFVKQVGDVFVAELSPAHFRRFHSWVAREGKRFSSSQWQRDRLSRVKSVIRFVRRKYPEWPWPAGILDWCDSYDVQPFRPKASNREPLPPDAFNAMIARCRAWSQIDPASIDVSTQSGRAKREQARRRQRDGVQFEAILRLGLNCGLDPVDIERLAWTDLRLDSAIPHLRFARRKVEATIGESVERITPLLPSTLDALRRWRTHENPKGGPLFRTSRKGSYSRGRVAQTWRRLRTEAGVDDRWSFKHLRNVGPSLAKRARLSSDEREAFLGHVVAGTSRFYEGDVDETYLIPLVNLIGEKYCGDSLAAD